MIELRVPGDKSITHRGIMLAALASGQSRITGALTGADCQATAQVLRLLGCRISELREGRSIVIDGVGLHGLHHVDDVLDCGNSGTTVRLLMGLAAGAGIQSTFDGDASLRSRPMRRITEPLQRMGARAIELGEAGRLPIRIEGGGLHGLEYESPQASAQVKSALLLAGLTAGVPVQVTEPTRTRDHTERMLSAMGVRVAEAATADGRHSVQLSPAEPLVPLDLIVPGDISSAAFILSAALIGIWPGVRVTGVGVNPTRTGFLDVLQAMGADLSLENLREQGGEPVADLVARPGPLRGVEVDTGMVPRMVDEIPMLAGLAVRAQGETVIRGAGELRVKESDRIRAMVENLRSIGVEAEELEDGMVIQGTDRPLRGAVTTRLDHRIAMVFGVLAAEPGNSIVLDDPDIVAVSYPDFWAALHGDATP